MQLGALQSFCRPPVPLIAPTHISMAPLLTLLYMTLIFPLFVSLSCSGLLARWAGACLPLTPWTPRRLQRQQRCSGTDWYVPVQG